MDKTKAKDTLVNCINNLKLTRAEFETLMEAVMVLHMPPPPNLVDKIKEAKEAAQKLQEMNS